MSLKDLGKNDISEETQALKDRLASRDTECAGLRTQLMRREAELDELRTTLNETVYKLSKEAERALQFEEEASTRSSELKTERMSLRNTELALKSAQDKLKAEERAKRELESTLDTVSLHSQTTSAEHQSVQREKRALEGRVRELERIVQTHESRRVSNVPHRGRSRSSSVSNFRLPAVEQELNDTKVQLHTAETRLRSLEQKLSQAQDELVKAENVRISLEKTSQRRISELLSTLERKDEELESLRETDSSGEREEELLKRIDEDAAKIASLEMLVAESHTNRANQARLQKLQSQLKAECEKVHRSEDLQDRLLREKEELVGKYEASQREICEIHELLVAREDRIKELEAQHAHLITELETRDRCKGPSSSDAEPSSSPSQGNAIVAFSSESALADHIQTLLQAIERLRDERDGLKRALEFSEVEYRITTEGFEARIASLTKQLTGNAHATMTDQCPINHRVKERMKQLTSCAAAFSVVISNLQTHLDLSEDRLSSTIADLTSSNSQLHDALLVIDSQKRLLTTNEQEHDILHKLDVTTQELSESNEDRDCLRLHLTTVEEQVSTMVERAEASEAALTTLNKNYQDIESERNSLLLQVTNLQDDLARVQDELEDAQSRYNTLHAQQLSEMPASEVVKALKDRIQELEDRIAHHTDRIGDYQHDIRRLEANVKLHEERIAEMVPELELLASQKETMVEDCAEAREARDEAIERLEAVEEEAEELRQQLQQMKDAHDVALSAMSSMVENLTSEKQQTTARVIDLETENAGFGRELDALRHDYQDLGEQLNAAVSHSQSLELEISREKVEMQQTVISFAVIYRAYTDSVRHLQGSYQCVTSLKSQLLDLGQDLEQQRTVIDSAEQEKQVLLQRLLSTSGATGRSQDNPTLETTQDGADLLRNALQEKERELGATRQALEEAKCRYAEAEAELVERINTMTEDLQVQGAQAERTVNLQEEVESLQTQLQSSLQNFADLEKLHDEVIQEFASAKQAFESRLAETDERIRTLDADHQQSLSGMEAEYRRNADILTSHLEDREHEMDELRQELRDVSEEHARVEGNLREELRAFESRHALANDLEEDLRRAIADMHQQLMQTEAHALALQEEITSLHAEIQRSTSLIRYLENQIRESESANMLLKKSLQRLELSLAESEKASKAAEFELSLQTTQHEKLVTALRREIASLQSGPDLRSALADLEEKNRDMDDLLKAKCQEIEEYDDRILETLKANKKLTGKVESLTRKVQALQARLSSMKNQPQEPVVEVAPPKKAPSVPSPLAMAPTTSYAGHPSSARVWESSAPSSTSRSKTPELRAQPVVVIPASHTPCGNSELSGRETSVGKKRRAPDDDERDSVPAEGHYSTDVGIRNGPTPRLRRTHGHPGGFTPVRGASLRKPASPARRTNVVAIPSEIITDVTNSPRGASRQGDAQMKKKGWLGKIRGGAGSQSATSRLGTFGGQ